MQHRRVLRPVHTSNNVEATFDFVAFDNVVSTLSLMWTGFRWITHFYRPSTRLSTNGI